MNDSCLIYEYFLQPPPQTSCLKPSSSLTCIVKLPNGFFIFLSLHSHNTWCAPNPDWDLQYKPDYASSQIKLFHLFYTWIRMKFRGITRDYRAFQGLEFHCFSELTSKLPSPEPQNLWHAPSLLLLTFAVLSAWKVLLKMSEVFSSVPLQDLHFLTTLYKIIHITLYLPQPNLFLCLMTTSIRFIYFPFLNLLFVVKTNKWNW